MRRYTLEQKKEWLEAFDKSNLNITEACEKTGFNRLIIKRWRKLTSKDLFIDSFEKCTFKEAMDEYKEKTYDKIQAVLINKALDDKDVDTCKYLSEKLMKHHGYGVSSTSDINNRITYRKESNNCYYSQ